jgi:hypothetical protein
MTVKELKIGDVFRVVGKPDLWRKETQRDAYPVTKKARRGKWLSMFSKKELELVERAETSEIRRVGNTLVLRNGEVLLKFEGAWAIFRCTPGEKFTEFVLASSNFMTSDTKQPTTETALGFTIIGGNRHLERPISSMIFAYKGRVYARATKEEATGKSGKGGYKKVLVIEKKSRLIIAGLLTLPGEAALYDIIQEHFGTVAT